MNEDEAMAAQMSDRDVISLSVFPPRDLPEITLAEAVETCHRIADKMRMDEDPTKVGAHE